MALYDQRIFRVGDDWWVARVSGATGVGVSTPVEFDKEMVWLTNITNRTTSTRIARIPAGFLNHIDHHSILQVLENSSSLGSRIELSPTNPPSGLPNATAAMTDDEGLQWSICPTMTMKLAPTGIQESVSVDFICLDDSALHGQVVLEDVSLEVLKSKVDFDVETVLVRKVKEKLHRFDPRDDDS